MNFDIIYKRGVTGSTNDDVWDLANHGAHPGVAVRALRQESGRGQWKTRPWVSPEGGLYFSVLLEPRIPEEEFPSDEPSPRRGRGAHRAQHCGCDRKRDMG